MTPRPSRDGSDTSPSSKPSGADEGLRRRGTVQATTGGVYTVELDGGTRVEASLRGRIKRDRASGRRVVIGDRVVVRPSGDAWVVEATEERTSAFVRKGPGGRRPKVVAANLDRVLVVVAARDPDPHLELVDRLLVAGEASGMRPLLVVNKVDLAGAESVAVELRSLYGGVGYETLLTSAESGRGIQDLGRRLARGSSALVGPSGVGKSTLLNAVDPRLDLRTAALSRKTGRGRHTTVDARLLELSDGGVVADTPGFGDVGLWGVEPDELDRCFPELGPHLGRCRFRGCSHLHEPECGVQEAVEAGEVASSRYQSYRTLRHEADEEPRY